VAYRHVVVGAGLTGSVIARVLTDAGRRVLVVERRTHVGGNVADAVHPSGFRYNLHGPHYFRTSSPRIWEFVNRFAEFVPYAARVQALVDGGYEAWPVSATYIQRVDARWTPPCVDTPPMNFEEAVLRRMPRLVYDRFVRDYTEKQWGRSPSTLSVTLARRVRVRFGSDERLTPRHRFQGLPRDGYHAFVAHLLQGIPVETGVEYSGHRSNLRPTESTVFTGGIDEYFGYDLGRLGYRGQRRTHVYHDVCKPVQPVVQVNTPQHASGPGIRVIEWSHLPTTSPEVSASGTLLTQEEPCTATAPDEREYPIPDAPNSALFARYHAAARAARDVLICGRLGEYRYLDMDQAIARAMVLACHILTT
jgi:UDP-galactopyranose mutase